MFFIILFGIKELKKLWKKTFKTIHKLSCFLGHPVPKEILLRLLIDTKLIQVPFYLTLL